MSLKLSVHPEKAVVISRGRKVVAASWFGEWVRRPYIYPFLAPGEREVTRLDHPGDPVTHSHHKSIWIAHHDVGGTDFWGDSPRSGRIEQTGIDEREDEGPRVGARLALFWKDRDGKELLEERRRLTFFDLEGGGLALEIDCELRAARDPVELGVTNFGLLGIRVARTIRVHEGLGGLILNSLEGENEAGCFGQHAVWCDYSGPVPLALPEEAPDAEKKRRDAGTLPAAVLGIACFDHPENQEGEVLWHVRDDGWMGPSLTRRKARTITREEPLRARYRIESHAGRPWDAKIDARYRAWRRREG